MAQQNESGYYNQQHKANTDNECNQSSQKAKSESNHIQQPSPKATVLAYKVNDVSDFIKDKIFQNMYSFLDLISLIITILISIALWFYFPHPNIIHEFIYALFLILSPIMASLRFIEGLVFWMATGTVFFINVFMLVVVFFIYYFDKVFAEYLWVSIIRMLNMLS